jgi:hypothetical protein
MLNLETSTLADLFYKIPRTYNKESHSRILLRPWISNIFQAA